MGVSDDSMPCPACRSEVEGSCPACGSMWLMTRAFASAMVKSSREPGAVDVVVAGVVRELSTTERGWDDRETYSTAMLSDLDNGLWYGMSVHLINGQWCDSGGSPHESRDAAKAAELALMRAIAERARG